MLDENLILIVDAMILVTAVILIYLCMDMSLHGYVYKLLTSIMEYWYNSYCKSTNNYKRNEWSVMYNHYRGGFSQQRYADVWVNKYIDNNDPSKGRVLIKKPYFNESDKLYEWRWLISKGEYGWYEKDVPLPKAEPSMYISEGAREEVIRILAEYAASKNPEPAVENEEKETKSTNVV